MCGIILCCVMLGIVIDGCDCVVCVLFLKMKMFWVRFRVFCYWGVVVVYVILGSVVMFVLMLVWCIR